ncbi:DUF6612 family protein [Geomicrobium sediminis]|uniref:Uncharacterized protein n=1 Tax=Geomicrobium sediminis TaxID=1347788 RepID=A0ABS2P7K5_9BACL|nr:DUF6612 family protein [Geomicrobium sediminis]MBM7631399.1 hypothetical protein [Geomicrobium sediminis]
MKKRLMTFGVMMLIVASGCTTTENPEDIFNRSKTILDESTENVHFKKWQNLQINGESMNANTRGAMQLHPLDAYVISTLDLVDFNEPLEFRIHINDEEAYVEEGEDIRQFSDDIQGSFLSMVNPIDEMNRYEPFQESMLMKEIEDFYEVSFRTDQEQHIPLVLNKMEQWGMIDEELGEDMADNIEIERIDMVAFIDKETYELHQFDTRYRFTVELQGDLQQVDDQQSIVFDHWNEVSDDVESFVHEILEEEQRQAQDDEELEEEIETE